APYRVRGRMGRGRSADADEGPVARADVALGGVHAAVAGVDELVASGVDADVTRLVDEVARLGLGARDGGPGRGLVSGAARQVDAVLTVDPLHEAGAVPARGGGSAVDVRDADAVASGGQDGVALAGGRRGGLRLFGTVLARLRAVALGLRALVLGLRALVLGLGAVILGLRFVALGLRAVVLGLGAVALRLGVTGVLGGGALVGAGGAVVLTALLGRRALRRLALFGLGLLSGLALGLLGGGDLLFRRTDLDGDGTGGRGQSRLDLRAGLAVTLVGGLDRGEADRGEVGDRNRGSGIGLRSGIGLGSGIRVRLGRRGGGTTEEHAGGHRGAGGDTAGAHGGGHRPHGTAMGVVHSLRHVSLPTPRAWPSRCAAVRGPTRCAAGL